ncbi:hypothetical protein HPB50_006314 [Hyalomma asiaticum]|uniref:Uncharacterized protein n=1 Tax=Hyalomma asiaticum TaxID=266040 RepID=A0ACB7TFX5_HYAAI|nr:hypothetical protein HPB50_006314 [Hyalomma asiaticum]
MDEAIGQERVFHGDKTHEERRRLALFKFYRMTPGTFNLLHSMVQEHLTKEKCPSGEPISSGERLALTLR